MADATGAGIDLLFHFHTSKAAEQAEQELATEDLPCVQSITVHDSGRI